MNREQIENMPAGNKLDMLIELDIFGWPKGYDDARDVPPYSTDINVAFKVVEKFYSMTLTKDSNGERFTCYLVCEINGKNADGQGYGDTAPLAICRAALLTKVET